MTTEPVPQTALEQKWEAEKKETAEKAKQLPDPTGYHLLCAVPKMEKTYESGIIKADITLQNEEILTTVLMVVKVGPDAYKDPAKFPTGPWAKPGDFVIVRSNSGTRIDIHGTEWRLINDDTVEATIQDPRAIRRR